MTPERVERQQLHKGDNFLGGGGMWRCSDHWNHLARQHTICGQDGEREGEDRERPQTPKDVCVDTPRT